MSRSIYAIIIFFYLAACSTSKKNVHLSKKKLDRIKSFYTSQARDSIIINPPYLTEPTSTIQETNFVSINTFYVTDRNIILKGGKPNFGIERSDMHYGICTVSIPKNHSVGNLESPILSGVKFLEDTDKHICILNIGSINKNVFYRELNSHTEKAKKNDIYIFIHGYNVTFAEAAKSSAQIYYDFGLKGIPIFYSWPSQGDYSGYPIDKENSEWSTLNFKKFLRELLINNKSSNVYLIAHSMGSKILFNTLNNLSNDKINDKERIKEIIFIAPDIDADIFQENMPHILSQIIPVTLYVSKSDIALKVSKYYNGHYRAGDAKNKLLLIKGMETIDATNVSTDIFGHSYFNSSRSVVDDISYLINNNLRANQRRLQKVITRKGSYWEFYK